MAERYRGFTLGNGGLLTWGDRLLWRESTERAARELRGPGPALTAACLAGPFAVACDPEGLFRYPLAGGRRELIDRGVVTADMVPATLFGRHGVVLIHKHAQLRFYQFAPGWPVRDLYSIYTPSWQGGLLVADVDGTGHLDLFCGNYWLRAPERFDLPWRLFAINTWTETEPSGVMRLAWDGRSLYAAQRLLAPARVARFDRPADPTAMWPARRLPDALHPVSLEIAKAGLLLAERGGRITLWQNGRPRELARGRPLVQAAFHGSRILVMSDEEIYFVTGVSTTA